jgi:hypothetical protein
LTRAGGDRDKFYREQLIPLKLEGYVAYIRRRNWRTDVTVIARTFAAVLLSTGGSKKKDVRIPTRI